MKEIKSLINDLAMFKNLTTTLYVDNLSAIKLIKNPEFHRRNKHIDVRYNFIRDKFKKKKFLLQHIASEDQQRSSDEILRRTVFQIQRNRLNIKNIEDIMGT